MKRLLLIGGLLLAQPVSATTLEEVNDLQSKIGDIINTGCKGPPLNQRQAKFCNELVRLSNLIDEMKK